MKKLMIIAAMMLATLSVNAQEFFIKPMAGGTLTTITGDVDDVKMKIGFTGGVELGYHFNEMFALTAGALYSMREQSSIAIRLRVITLSTTLTFPCCSMSTWHQVSPSRLADS